MIAHTLRVASIALAALLLPLAVARGQDAPLTLRRVHTAGDRWSAEEELIVELQFSVSQDGTLLKAVDQTTRRLRKREVTALEVAQGKLAAVRATFAAECTDTEQERGEELHTKPCALAGQSVTVRRQATGEAAVECAVDLGEEEAKEARELLDPSEGLLPRKPVKPGDRWVADAGALAQLLDLGPEDRGTLRLRLKSVSEVAGRKVAELEAALVMDGTSITFTAAGAFTDRGAVSILNHGYPLVEAPGSGTYQVENHTMTLRFGDGRVYRLAYSGHGYTPGEQRPAQLVLSYNEDVLLRR